MFESKEYTVTFKDFYSYLYRITEKVTPLPVDCGRLCDGSCCKGDDESGMYLFPGEKVMYENLPGWAKVQKSGLVFAGEKVDFFTCTGKCDRTLRPLACRIFPLFPFIDISGNLEIIMDPRGKGLCPLAGALHTNELDKKFVDTVRYVSKLMMKNSLLYSYMFELSRFTEQYANIFSINNPEDKI